MLWIKDCPFSWDQGMVGPVVMADGSIALCCDSDGAIWRTMEDMETDRRTDGAAQTEIGGGDPKLRPETVRWAEREDLEGTPWAGLEWKEL